MAFQFPLESLLRFRQSLERQQEILLQQANFQAAELRRMIAALERAAGEIRASNATDLRAGTCAAELHFNALRLSMLAERRLKIEAALVQAEERCALRRQALQHSRQQREIIDSLRKRQLHSYEDLQKKREQRRLDDLFLLRRDFLRRG